MSVRKALVLSAAIALALLGAAPVASASPFGHHGRGHAHHQRDSWSSDDEDISGDDSPDTDQPDTVTPSADTTTGQAAAAGGTVRSGAAQTITAELTGFAAADNNPAGSTTISQGVIHQQAGGTGTFQDPLTAASPGSAGSTESPKGTRFYLPSVHRYVIIEDSGATKMSHLHLDVWNGTGSKSVTDKCESDMTGTFQIIRNPAAGLVVHPGPLADSSGCHF
jgi:hypothetical protein